MSNWVLDLPVGDRSGYDKGYVRCPDCQNLEIYWDGERVFYHQCAVRPVRMKIAEARWRRCPLFRWRRGDPVFHRTET